MKHLRENQVRKSFLQHSKSLFRPSGWLRRGKTHIFTMVILMHSCMWKVLLMSIPARFVFE